MCQPVSSKIERLHTAPLKWRGDQPICLSHDDIYFSLTNSNNCFAETEHVFIQGNNLPSRFEKLKDQIRPAGFRICELGFGTGLNILTLCHYWAQRGHKRGHLHLISIEGYPLTRDDFIRSQQYFSARHPHIASISKQLIDCYPPFVKGQYVIRLSDDITLTLIWEDVAPALQGMSGQIDAFLLDGFAPAKNESMWTDTVFSQLARLSCPDSSLATFTVASKVRQGLTKAGFVIGKRAGFGCKRDMLIASRRPQFLASIASGEGGLAIRADSNTQNDTDTNTEYKSSNAVFAAPIKRGKSDTRDPFRPDAQKGRTAAGPISGAIAGSEPIGVSDRNCISGPDRLPDPDPLPDPDRLPDPDQNPGPISVVIIGAGIAGSALAYHLRRFGAAPVLIDKGGRAHGASGNPAGLLMPRLDLPASPAFHFYRQAYLYTVRFLEQFNDVSLFRRMRGKKKPKDPAEHHRHRLLFEAGILPETELMIAASGELSFPRAGLIYPKALIDFLTREVDFIRDEISGYERTRTGWQIKGAGGDYRADAVVVTAGADMAELVPALAPALSVSRGQIDIFKVPEAPKSILTEGQYCAPLASGTALAGATYKDVSSTRPVLTSPDDTAANQAAAARLLVIDAEALSPVSARAALRCVARDYNPISGPVPDPSFDLDSNGRPSSAAGRTPAYYVLSGLGSRGLVTAPYLAEDLARQIIGAPGLLCTEERTLVDPARLRREHPLNCSG